MRICSIENCGKPLFARTWCHMHYNLWRRNGDPLARKVPARTPRPPDGLCTAPDCDAPARAMALCGRHYHHLNRYGDPLHTRPPKARGTASPSWKGEAATYGAKHQRVYAARGRAADHPCIWIPRGNCKGRVEWASQTGNLDDVEDFAP